MELMQLKGIGSKTAELFAKLGVHSQEELLEFFPRDHELFFSPLTIGEIGYKTFAAVRGAFTGELVQRRVRNKTITTATFQDEIGKSMKVTWFNAPYMKDAVHPGRIYILRGRINRKFGVVQMNQPKVFSPEEYTALMHTMQPVYPLTKGLSNQTIINAIKQAMNGDAFSALDKNDILPEAVRDRYGLCTKSEAVQNIHFPKDQNAYMTAAMRMSFEEIFLFILMMKENESSARIPTSVQIVRDPRTEDFIKSLPFALTNAQLRVSQEMTKDLSSGHCMNRLIQGDVGSGKTIVALLSLMDAAFAGYQGTLMAPTEVLAAQHFHTIEQYFKEYHVPLHAALLTGSMTALEKKVVYDALEDGRIDILVGTHALFQEKVNFKNLGLVITDEQHRFGIKQRQMLAEKAAADAPAHVAVMSATPIPRTLALIIYGNMDVSVIDELPASRKPIKNAVVDESYKPNAYRFIEREVAGGHQVYIICPLVEYSEGLDAQNVTDYSELLRDILPETITIGMLHGQMPQAKKNEIMNRFAAGEISVLVSTTVVEVGVDVPNATVMMIEDANRFGLATLHQLRGRVGRGADQSYCIFISNNQSKEAMERLEVLNHSNDGFEIASKDLALRGPGEFMGIRQSGALSFKNFDIYRDAEIAQKAQEAARDYRDGILSVTPEEDARLKAQMTAYKGGILL